MDRDTLPIKRDELLLNTQGDGRWKPIALLVEPDGNVRKYIEDLLRELGCERYGFPDSASALRFLPMLSAGRTPDLILQGTSARGGRTDLDFRAQLQTMPHTAQVPFYSYYCDGKTADPLLKQRISAYVSTVFQRRRLLAATKKLQDSTEKVRAASAPPRRPSGAFPSRKKA